MLDNNKIDPNINKNPLIAYGSTLGGSVNALEEDEEELEEALDLKKLEIPKKELFGMFSDLECVQPKPLIIK